MKKFRSGINLDHKLMQEAGDLIAAGELVAFPTETVYGLAVML